MSLVLAIIGALLARVAELEDELHRRQMRFRHYKEDIEYMRRPI
jgi:hypothetical protein